MEGAFLFALVGLGLLRPATQPEASSDARGFNLWLALLNALICAAYAPSLAINFQYQDWDFRLASSAIHSWHDAAALFTRPQADGFYRPLTFLSLWLDYLIYGDHTWGYHLQSIALHILNCILVLVLARTLGFAERIARWAAVLFAVAAVNFEPVLWPAARFDLAATACTLLACIFALRYLRGGHARTLAFSGIALMLGILNKESAYCFPLVIGCLVLSGAGLRPANLRPANLRPRSLSLAVVTLLSIGVMLRLRLAVLRGVGGYAPAAETGSPHFVFNLKTLSSLFTKLPVAFFGINSSVTLPLWLIAAIAVLAIVMVAAILGGARAARQDMVLLLCAVLSAVPTLNIINWIGEPMQQARYLYTPGVWLALFLASVLSRVSRSAVLLALWAAANLAGLEHNLNVYRTTLAQTRAIGERVRQDGIQTPDVRSIHVEGLPEQPNGVFFAGSEIISQLKAAIPGAVILSDSQCADLSYRWNAPATDLVREPLPASCPNQPQPLR
jgi:Dolichyl-phosphate-mannose-protein mannosyltransferase